MATFKRFNTIYTIDGPQTIIKGNLIVEGVQTSVTSTDTYITDKLINLNNGETGAGVGPAGTGSAGLIVNRGTLANVVLRWYEPYQKWQITNDGSVYANIAVSTGNKTYLTAVIEDTGPALGGNLNTNNQTISSNVGNINFTGNLQINNSVIPPTAAANATVVYSASPAAGTSGVYVVNGSAANQELVTKTRAFGYSLIL
jgi:hypothetical protein